MREREEEGTLAWRPGGAVTETRQERGEAGVSKNKNAVQVHPACAKCWAPEH